MKELMLGNKALASIVSGHQMRRWLWKWHMARVWVESEAQRQ